MTQIIDNLKSFNSKERFYLVGHILGNPEFTPCAAFRKCLENVLHIELPESVFAAMDYHIDWLYASLFLASNQKNPPIFENHDKTIKAQQEDIDFLIAYEKDEICHIIMLEAKGVGVFTNNQMRSKASRLGQIFGEDGGGWPGVVPHFVLISPKKPTGRLQSAKWPAWMLSNNSIPWIELPIPANLKKVTRCNSDKTADKDGKCWTVLER